MVHDVPIKRSGKSRLSPAPIGGIRTESRLGELLMPRIYEIRFVEGGWSNRIVSMPFHAEQERAELNKVEPGREKVLPVVEGDSNLLSGGSDIRGTT